MVNESGRLCPLQSALSSGRPGFRVRTSLFCSQTHGALAAMPTLAEGPWPGAVRPGSRLPLKLCPIESRTTAFSSSPWPTSSPCWAPCVADFTRLDDSVSAPAPWASAGVRIAYREVHSTREPTGSRAPGSTLWAARRGSTKDTGSFSIARSNQSFEGW